MNIRNLSWIILALALVPLSCVKNKEPGKSKQQEQDQQVKEADDINATTTLDTVTAITILGEKIDNPYTIHNMRKAVDSIIKWDDTQGDIPAISQSLDITDLYVRFLPSDTNQLDKLYGYDIELFDVPLDYEILEGGTHYHDSTTGTDFTWLYSVVKPDFKFPADIKYELIDSLFIPEHDPGYIEEPIDTNSNARLLSRRNLISPALEAVANYITGNVPVSESPNARKICILFGRVCWYTDSWTPSGRITVQEAFQDVTPPGTTERNQTVNRTGNVKGIKVRTRRYVKIRTTYTDANGFYSFPNAFKNPVNYSLVFENRHVKVVNGVGFIRRYNGPKRRGSWNHHIGYSHSEWLDATILNACYDFDVARRSNSFLRALQDPFSVHFKITIRSVRNKGGTPDWWPTSFNLIPIVNIIRPGRIRIFRINNKGTILQTDNIYEIVAHELGHQSHWRLMNNRAHYVIQQRLVQESWADFIGYYISLIYYPNARWINSTYYSDNRNKWWSEAYPNRSAPAIRLSGSKYTPIFIDLVDDHNQLRRVGPDRADDDVSGYTVLQIQTAIKNATNRINRRTIFDIRDYLRDRYANPTEANLDRLFRFYEQF